MHLTGEHFVGSARSLEGEATFTARDPHNEQPLDVTFADATDAEIDRAMVLAREAHAELRSVGRPRRADFLDTIAANIEALGDALIERTSAETGLPTARLVGERGRTATQLRLFADEVRDGTYLEARIDHADPDRQPIPKPDVRRMLVPLGPVVVFGASNFPLAFSVAGGDTASVLAAGCPVVIKAHPHHPGASEMVASAIVDAVAQHDLPAGTFSLVHGVGHRVGQALVEHPATTAVGFTGSLAGGRALFDLAAARAQPIPVYAEMGSTNPVFVLPAAAAERGEEIGAGLAGSVTLGVGQFCTNPGLVFVPDSAEPLIDALASALRDAPEGIMLHAGIGHAYREGLERLVSVDGVEVKTQAAAQRPSAARPALFITDVATFCAHPELHEEVFGPSTLLVRYTDGADLARLTRCLGGQLTATLHASEADMPLAGELLPLLEERAGRVLFGGFPTGVEVCHAMQHGGPYPSTTAPGTTSVGTAAIARWLRPVAWQNAPAELLPPELRDDNPSSVVRRVNGEWLRS